MNKRRKVIGLVLLALYLCVGASANLFYHSHVFSWGTIVHSHFFAHANHQHTQQDCDLISLFALVSSEQTVSEVSFVSLPLAIIAVLSFPISDKEGHICVKSSNLRAPPAACR